MSENSKNELLKLKILLLGDNEVGKKSYILRFCEDKFQEETLTKLDLGIRT